MNEFDAYSFLAQGAVTKAGDNAARERVMLADSIAQQRSAKALQIVRARRHRRATLRNIIRFAGGSLVVGATVVLAVLGPAMVPA